jgi:uncharacterized repeat protein (TIGR03803 family)
VKICIDVRFLVFVLILGLGWVRTNPATAQTFTTLHNFSLNDGYGSQGALVLSSNTLYGTALYGGTNGSGTVFALNNRGSNFIVLHSFTATSGIGTNSDGDQPYAGLVLSGTNLYGTATFGGTNGNGTVFSVSTNGSNFITLHTFMKTSGIGTNSDGSEPTAGLVLSDNTLYGAAAGGGSNGVGTVFALGTNGSNFITLHSLMAAHSGTNSDGVDPYAGLFLSGNSLYGTAAYGGTNGYGTVFSVSTNGSNFITLHTFTIPSSSGTNSDGAEPAAGLILSGNTLYGTAPLGGTNGNGTVFSVSTNGSNFTVIHTFSALATAPLGYETNSDGTEPAAGLVLSGNTLYGTAQYGGSNGFGTVFALNTNGSNFITLHNFSILTGNPLSNSDGVEPAAGLVISGSTLYGTTIAGGTNGYGTVFSIDFSPPVVPPLLAIALSGTNVILNWPTNAAGFTLESITNLVPPAIWVTNQPPPVVVGTNNVVTNGISGTQKYYRLSQ